MGCSIWLVQEAWTNKGSLNWWVAPTFAQSKNAYETIKRMLPKGTFVEYKADLRLVLVEPDGSEHSRIEFKSADNDASLRGFAVNSFVLDEAAYMSEEAFISVLTTVTQTRGRGIIISTPKGRGWFYDCYSRGEKADEFGQPRFNQLNPDPYPEWMAVRMPTWTNPHVPIESVREAKNNMSEDQFRQEYAAQFLEESAGVFRGVNRCIDLKNSFFTPYIAGRRYIVGVDLARLRDYSVVIVLDADTLEVVYMERFNKIEWAVQYHKIIQIAKSYNASVGIDSTGIGDPIVETLRAAGISCEPYKIGGSTAKQQLIEKLRIAIENARVTIPYNRVTTILVEELKSFEYSFTDGGTIRYEAPSGKHDDCVIALALAFWFADVPAFTYRAWSQRGI
jgi:Terminase RNaseH-like domain/Terminase large subunit, T4likevirus-type, N-terminal